MNQQQKKNTLQNVPPIGWQHVHATSTHSVAHTQHVVSSALSLTHPHTPPPPTQPVDQAFFPRRPIMTPTSQTQEENHIKESVAE